MRIERFEENGFSFELLGSRPSQSTEFVAVIGANGTGKSRLLGEIADFAEATAGAPNATYVESDAPTLAVSNLISDPFKRSTSRTNVKYLGVRTRAGSSTSTGSIRSLTVDAVLSSERDGWRSRAVQVAAALAGIETLQIRSKTWRRSPEAKNTRSRLGDQQLGTLEWDLREYGERILKEGATPFSWTEYLTDVKLMASRHQLSDTEAIELGWKYAIPRPDLVVSMRGVTRDITDLSVGQLLLVSTVARIAGNIEPGSLVLIDEPEIGLHPSWQSAFISLLRDAIPLTFDCQIFIATHSPHIVADADHVLVPGSTWGAFVEFEGGIAGRSVENLLYRVFEARVQGNSMAEEDLGRLARFVAGTQVGPIEAAVERLRGLAAEDTPVVNSLLASYDRIVMGGEP